MPGESLSLSPATTSEPPPIYSSAIPTYRKRTRSQSFLYCATRLRFFIAKCAGPVVRTPDSWPVGDRHACESWAYQKYISCGTEKYQRVSWSWTRDSVVLLLLDSVGISAVHVSSFSLAIRSCPNSVTTLGMGTNDVISVNDIFNCEEGISSYIRQQGRRGRGTRCPRQEGH